jgi:preprotein translocase SecE subunit
MADKKEKNIPAKKAVAPKKKTSMRESSAKTRAKAEKPKRVRKAASAAKRPVSSVGSALKKEFHLLGSTDEEKRNKKFLTKSRKLTPGFFRSAWAEMKFVTWPGRKETWRLVFAVFVFAIVLGTLITVLDYALERLLREVIL